MDFMNQILLADDVIFAERSNNQCVIANSLLVAFATLVDQFVYWPQIWVPLGSTWFHSPQHVNRSLVELHKGATEDLAKGRSSSPFRALGSRHRRLWSGWQMPVCLPQVHRHGSFSCRPSHAELSSVHLPVFFVIVRSCFIGKFPSSLAKHFWGKVISQALDLQLCKTPSPLPKGFWCSRNLLLFFCTLHGSSRKRGIKLNLCPQEIMLFHLSIGSRWVNYENEWCQHVHCMVE